MESRKDLANLYISPVGFGRAIGVSGRRVNQLIADGVLVRDKNGKLEAETQLLKYCLYLKNQKETKDDEAKVDYWDEKAKHEKAKRELTEIRLDKTLLKMHDAQDIELVLSEMLTNLRTQLLGIPTQLAAALANKTSEEIYTVMTEAIETRLAELSEYRPDMFQPEVYMDYSDETENTSATT